MIGLVAFSFALRDDEPNPCNRKLAHAVERIRQGEPTGIAIVSQWEIAKQLTDDGISCAHVVELRADGKYLDSSAVWQAAKAYFEAHRITKVIPVAQPFLQLAYVSKMIERDGFEILRRDVGTIGFDDSDLNKQPWTRNRLAFAWKVVKITLLGRDHGNNGQQ